MVELSKKQLLGIVSLAMILTGVVGISIPEDTYYCPSRDMVLECTKLSSTGKSCYIGITYKICREGWEPIENYLESNGEYVEVLANNKQWKCLVDSGEVNSYSKCISGSYEGYLGELI